MGFSFGKSDLEAVERAQLNGAVQRIGKEMNVQGVVLHRCGKNFCCAFTEDWDDRDYLILSNTERHSVKRTGKKPARAVMNFRMII